MNAPEHLKHKPIIAVDDYDLIDGIYAGNSDAKALSIGNSQYDDEISVKIFRKPKDKWSRQSEELPIHRNLDLTILILETLAKNNISGINKRIVNQGDLTKIDAYFKENNDLINKKISLIKQIINSL